ncbi:MAG TPA: hypothetical protein VIL99_08080 [Ignavibacteria bacterium]
MDKSLLISLKLENNLFYRDIKFIEPLMVETYPFEDIKSILKYKYIDSNSISVELTDELSVINPPPVTNNYKFLNINDEIIIEDGIKVQALQSSKYRQGYASKILIQFPPDYLFENFYVLFYNDNKIYLKKYREFCDLINSN